MQFVDLLRRSKICDDHQLGELIVAFDSKRRQIATEDDAIAEFCRMLLVTNAATEWQCNKLKMGRWKGFKFGHYLLLEQDGKGSDYSSYRSRDTRDGSIVRVTVTPINQSKGDLKYRVERWIE